MEANTTRQQIIERIVEEKGESALPNMLALMVRASDDSATCEMIMEYLLRIGKPALPVIRSMLHEFSLDREWKIPGIDEIDQGDSRLIKLPIFYLSEVLGELGSPKDLPLLFKLLGLLDEEQEQLFIYEAIARLGGGRELIDLLGYYVKEDESKARFLDHAIIVLSYINDARAFELIVDVMFQDWLDPDQVQHTVSAIRHMTHLFPERRDQLAHHPLHERIVELLDNQQKAESDK